MTTRAGLRQSISYALGDMRARGTATAGSTTTLTDAPKLSFQRADALLGDEITIDAGLGSGQSLLITDSTTAGQVTFPTASAVDATSTYEIHHRWRAAEYNEAIAAAYDNARTYILLDKIDESIILNNIVHNGLIANWDSSSAMTGWSSASGTVARESSLVYNQYNFASRPQTYSGKFTNTVSTAGTFYYAVVDYPKYAGMTLTVRVWSHCLTASRLRSYVRYTTGGTDTYVRSSYHDANGWNSQDELLITQALPADLNTRLHIGVEIATGTAIDQYLGRIEATVDGTNLLPARIYEYPIPSGFVAIDKVEIETGQHGVFTAYPDRYWHVINDTSKRIRIDQPVSRRAIRLYGQKKATAPTADTSTIDLNEEYVKAFACWYLLQMKPLNEEANKLAYWGQRSAQLLRAFTPPIRGRQVEVVG